ncbi:hypothetical protein DFS34DRAFT_651907 [Phlyctochytrium arcticum]|nr:hypothetical protein DFS34DRAFT_651907 [Phlyctochytrium arcticum]
MSLLLISILILLGGGAQASSSIQTVLKPFTSCPPLARRDPPQSIHDLRADHITVIASLGDSITAGFAAKAQSSWPPTMYSTLEDRGVSFISGGDEGATTLARYFGMYGDVKGMSFGSHLPEICYGPACLPFQYRPQDHLNAAQSGAFWSNIQYELSYLITRMKTDPSIDYERDFKLINVFMGNNDACLKCLTPGIKVYYMSLLTHLLTEIRASVPNVVVNLMMGFNVSQVYDATVDEPYCDRLRKFGRPFVCACAFQSPETRTAMDELTQTVNSLLTKVAMDFNSPQNPTFKVIVDPLLRDVRVRDWGLDYLSRADCFHPALAAHEVMAQGVWYNLFRGDKISGVSPADPLPDWCPTDLDRIK